MKYRYKFTLLAGGEMQTVAESLDDAKHALRLEKGDYYTYQYEPIDNDRARGISSTLEENNNEISSTSSDFSSIPSYGRS